MWATRTMHSEETLSLWWLRATTAMLQMLIYTWISQYRSTGVKCAFLYILLIVFSLNSVCCFKAPSVLQQQLEEHFAMMMSVCAWVPRHYLYVCVRVLVSHFHRDTLDGHSKGQSLPWDTLDDPTCKKCLYCTVLGFFYSVRKLPLHSHIAQCVDLNQLAESNIHI